MDSLVFGNELMGPILLFLDSTNPYVSKNVLHLIGTQPFAGTIAL